MGVTAKRGRWHRAGWKSRSERMCERKGKLWISAATPLKFLLDKNFKGAEKHPAGGSVLGPHQSARKNNILVCLLQDLFLLQFLSFRWSAAANWQHIQKAWCFSLSRSACLWGFVLIRELPPVQWASVCAPFAKWRCVCECDSVFFWMKKNVESVLNTFVSMIRFV